MRLRHLTVLPGGVIALHSHHNRPAILHVMQGEMLEYSSSQDAPRHLKAGDTITEFNDVTQWAKNSSRLRHSSFRRSTSSTRGNLVRDAEVAIPSQAAPMPRSTSVRAASSSKMRRFTCSPSSTRAFDTAGRVTVPGLTASPA